MFKKFKIPDAEMEKFHQAGTEEAQRQILERFAQGLPVTNRTIKGVIRFCEKCQLIKPDRAHHCSVCSTCVLKMDHHCPWVNNCVGFHNYKFFMLFLAYALLYCIFITATSLQYLIRFWKGELDGMGRFHLLFLFFVALMFAVSLTSLFFYHCYLVLHNRSTLEAFTPPMFRTGKDKDGFSLGKYNNFQEVFGDNRKLWFLPIFTSLGNGVAYPVRAQHQGTSNTYDSMGSTRNRRRSGKHFLHIFLLNLCTSFFTEPFFFSYYLFYTEFQSNKVTYIYLLHKCMQVLILFMLLFNSILKANVIFKKFIELLLTLRLT
ncbi:palmitoyltransferase ZDHHC2-like isoform X9 [Bombus vosnesenskii]|uniref:Palmitoyltransferase n=1 Tax=Bombus vosnesenskii TaxID=207650 RepID=A0A6J3L2B0_9HYME|nr:palmitoyltransferase ZDHHC2-like isoform X9 [Bombus vosnesenskii]